LTVSATQKGTGNSTTGVVRFLFVHTAALSHPSSGFL
jgi:hypothetical protein